MKKGCFIMTLLCVFYMEECHEYIDMLGGAFLQEY